MDLKIINNIKSLGIDMINQANSGHPGIVLGASPIVYTVFMNHLNINIDDPKWLNRDRFVMSAGHGSALLYATLHMAGYNISVDDLKAFRQVNSITPGHPEYDINNGVESTTGPLGQGIANAVGMALAGKLLNKKNSLFDYKVYVLCSDGDLMEGIANEALSFAGSLNLNNLILLYDSNDICLRW
jgi:transketolase